MYAPHRDDGIKGHGVDYLCSEVVCGQTRTNDRILSAVYVQRWGSKKIQPLSS